ncbi:MAG: nucleotidyltransferase [bacterium]
MKNVIKMLNELKDKELIKDYAIGGAIATLRWTEPFFTRDLDVFIVFEQKESEDKLIILSPIYDYFENKGYLWEGQWIVIDGVPVDFIPVNGLEKEAVDNAKEAEFETIKTKVITPEYLITLFLNAGRDKDMRKIQMLLEQAPIDRNKLNDILDRYSLKEKLWKTIK